MRNEKTTQIIKRLSDLVSRRASGLTPEDRDILHAAGEHIAELELDGEWQQIGIAAVDSGQLMVADPCYIDSQWKREGEGSSEMLADGYAHADGSVYYCSLHGGPPHEDAKPFGRFDAVIEAYGKSMNELREAGEVKLLPKPPPSGEFSYTGCCEATTGGAVGGQLKFCLGHDGAGVVFSTGVGDGAYPVSVRVVDLEDWGKRVAEVRVLFLEPDED